TRTALNVAGTNVQSPAISKASAVLDGSGRVRLPQRTPSSRHRAEVEILRLYRHVPRKPRARTLQRRVLLPYGGRPLHSPGRASRRRARSATLRPAMTGDGQDWAGAPFTEKAFYLADFRERTLAVAGGADALADPAPLQPVFAELEQNRT